MIKLNNQMQDEQIKKVKRKKGFLKMPTIITILMIVTVLIWIISLIPFPEITTGSYYQKDPNDASKIVEVIVSNDNPLNITRLGVLDIFVAPFKGFMDRADFIVFLFTLGLFINLIMKTQCIEAGIGSLIKRLKNKEYILVPILMGIMSLLGTIYGFAEETLVLYPILVPIILASGFDTITSVFILFLGSAAGVAGSVLNPFSIGVATNVVNNVLPGNIVSVTTGIVGRITIWLILTIAFTLFTTLYALKVKSDPKKSYVFHNLSKQRAKFVKTGPANELPKLTKKRIWALVVFGMTFLLMVLFALPYSKWGFNGFEWFAKNISLKYAISTWLPAIGNWYFIDYAFLFLISSLILGFIFLRQKEQEFIDSIYEGWKEMVGLVIMISISSGIAAMLAGSQIDKWVTVAIQNSGLDSFPKWSFILIMLVVYILLGFIINSTSVMAILTFPFVAPLAYSMGGTNMIGVMFMVYLMGVNFTSLFTPTNVLFMAPLSLYGIPLTKWWKAQIIPLIVMALVAIAIPLMFAYLPIG